MNNRKALILNMHIWVFVKQLCLQCIGNIFNEKYEDID